MRRFLWAIVLACATLLVSATVFDLGTEHVASVGISEARPEPTRYPVEVELAEFVSQDAERVRAEPAVEASAGRPTSSAAERPIRHPGLGQSFHVALPTFRDGVVQVFVVRDEDSAPISGAEVRMDSGDSYWDLEEEDTRTATTDSGGATAFSGVRKGFTRLTAAAVGRATATRDVWLDGDSPIAIAEIRLLVQRELRVRLVDGQGRPFRAEEWGLAEEHAALLEISISSRCGTVGQHFDPVDAPGHVARSTEQDIGPNTWRLEIHGGGEVCVHAVLGDTVVGVEALAVNAAELAIRIDPAAIDRALAPVVVRVLDDVSGTPIVGARVEFHTGSSKPIVVSTGEDGRAQADLALSSNVVATVRCADRAPVTVTIQRPPPPEFVVRLPIGRRITGRIVDPDGKAIAGARVFLRDWESQPVDGKRATGRSAADGSFALADLAADRYEVRAQTFASKGAALVRGSERVDCRYGNARGVVVVLPIGN